MLILFTTCHIKFWHPSSCHKHATASASARKTRSTTRTLHPLTLTASYQTHISFGRTPVENTTNKCLILLGRALSGFHYGVTLRHSSWPSIAYLIKTPAPAHSFTRAAMPLTYSRSSLQVPARLLHPHHAPCRETSTPFGMWNGGDLCEDAEMEDVVMLDAPPTKKKVRGGIPAYICSPAPWCKAICLLVPHGADVTC